MKYSHLFSPGHIGCMRLKNRLVMPPMVRNYADARGMVTLRYVDHIERIARGGVGMMILEASYIRPDGKGFSHELGIHSDAVIPGLKKLVRMAHGHDAKIGIQLYHAGRQTSSRTTGVQPIGASAIAEPTVQEIPHALTVAEIRTIVHAFGQAARRAKEAGMDFVEIHAAHGYLVTQFLSPFSNKRTDAYGGSPTKRLRFLDEVYQAVRDAVGPDFCVIVRLSGDEMVAGGLRMKDTVAIAKHLESLGADGLHVSAGNYASYAQGAMIAPMAQPDGVIAGFARSVKRAVSIPVIAVGKLRKPEEGEKILQKKEADFIAIGRTLLADPDWVRKVGENRLDEICPCVACNQGCISRLFAQQDVWCTVNPACGRERLFAERPTKKKRILVIGGGPAGLSAAATAAERGHRVDLYERSATLGGQLLAAAAAPHRGDWNALRDALIRRVQTSGVTVHLKTPFSPDRIRENRYDLAIVATGSFAVRPIKIPGISGSHVILARDLLEGRARAKGRTVVVGGGCMGAQTAEFLAVHKHPVTVVEATDAIAAEAPIDDRTLLLERLKKLRVAFLMHTLVTSIGPKTVFVRGPKGVSELRADTVVVCLGSASEHAIVPSVHRVARRVTVVGDAKQPRRVTDAVIEGALAVLD